MKFKHAITLTPSIEAALRMGILKLQTGQWVYPCNDRSGPPSRFVCVRPGGSLWLVHPEGTRNVSARKFSATCKFWLSL